jgi:flagellar biosynthetic protein FliS
MDGSEAANGLGAYRVVAATGAEPEEFVKMALDAARTFLLQAEAAIVEGNPQKKARALGAAARVIEFMLGLSGIERGPLSDGLASVYQYALAAILKGNALDDGAAITAGRTAIEELAAVWRKVFPDTLTAEGFPDAAC